MRNDRLTDTHTHDIRASRAPFGAKNNCDHFVSRLCLELPVLQPRSDGGEDGRQRGAGPGRPHHRGQGNIKY